MKVEVFGLLGVSLLRLRKAHSREADQRMARGGLLCGNLVPVVRQQPSPCFPPKGSTSSDYLSNF